MDWVVWISGGILLIGLLVGVFRGALRIAVSIVTAVVTIVITVYATPYVANMIEEKTPLDESMKEYMVQSIVDASQTLLQVEETGNGLTEERVRKILKAAGVSEEELEEQDITVEDIVNGDVGKEELKKLGISAKILDGKKDAEEAVVDSLMENSEVPKETQTEVLENADLPQVFKNILMEHNNEKTYAELGAETFAQYVGTYLSKLMIHVATFLALFLLVTIVLRAIVFALNIVNEIPVFGILNRLAGGVAGIGCALLVVWFAYIVVTLFYTTAIGNEIYNTIQANELTRYIYDINPLLKISIKI